MSNAFAAPFFAAATLLVASGILKLRDPGPPSRALEAAGLPGGPSSVRLLGLAEITLGTSSIVVPHPWAATALAVTYAVFAAFLVRLRARRPDASCGCAGERELPPSLLHVAFDLVAAGSGVGLAVLREPGLPSILAGAPALAAPLVLGIGAVAVLAAAAVTLVPAAFGSYRGSHS